MNENQGRKPEKVKRYEDLNVALGYFFIIGTGITVIFYFLLKLYQQI